jgi:hypothetical protein
VKVWGPFNNGIASAISIEALYLIVKHISMASEDADSIVSYFSGYGTRI